MAPMTRTTTIVFSHIFVYIDLQVEQKEDIFSNSKKVIVTLGIVSESNAFLSNANFLLYSIHHRTEYCKPRNISNVFAFS
jgi:hypothetical protein